MGFINNRLQKHQTKFDALKIKGEEKNSFYFGLDCIIACLISLIIVSGLLFLGKWTISLAQHSFDQAQMVTYYVWLTLSVLIFATTFLIFIFSLKYTITTFAFQIRCNKKVITWIALSMLIIYITVPITILCILFV